MDFNTVPVGFGMALAQNEAATNAYAMMTKEQKQVILEKAHNARTRQEMEQVVAGILREN